VETARPRRRRRRRRPHRLLDPNAVATPRLTAPRILTGCAVPRASPASRHQNPRAQDDACCSVRARKEQHEVESAHIVDKRTFDDPRTCSHRARGCGLDRTPTHHTPTMTACLPDVLDSRLWQKGEAASRTGESAKRRVVGYAAAAGGVPSSRSRSRSRAWSHRGALRG